MLLEVYRSIKLKKKKNLKKHRYFITYLVFSIYSTNIYECLLYANHSARAVTTKMNKMQLPSEGQGQVLVNLPH